MRKTLLLISALLAVISSVNGQSGFEVNSGFIKPFSILDKDAPYTSGAQRIITYLFIFQQLTNSKQVINFFLV